MRLVSALDVNEREILVCLVRGMSNRQIAVTSRTSVESVESVRASMMTKLRAKSTADAVRIGLLTGVTGAD
jgi:two-component system response regulator FixJ